MKRGVTWAYGLHSIESQVDARIDYIATKPANVIAVPMPV